MYSERTDAAQVAAHASQLPRSINDTVRIVRALHDMTDDKRNMLVLVDYALRSKHSTDDVIRQIEAIDNFDATAEIALTRFLIAGTTNSTPVVKPRRASTDSPSTQPIPTRP
jgi:hypothetical protein